jgi:hypothetical protein
VGPAAPRDSPRGGGGDGNVTRKKRRGRPPQMPDDLTSMDEGYYDPWARTAWLLVTCRSLGRETAYADRSVFVEALRDAGVTTDLSRLSRWESGQHAITFKALRGYETVLGLPQGALVAANRQLVRDSDPAGKQPERVSFADRATEAPDALIMGLIEKATASGDPMTGGDWLTLVTELEHFELVLLPTRQWSLLCERLVQELARTTGVDQLRRFEALSTLISHPVGERHVRHALGAWLTDQDVQVVSPMLGLLQQLEDPAANQLVIKLLDVDSKALSLGAVQVAATKAARGHFNRVELAKLEQQAVRGLVTPRHKRGADLLDLLTHLPDDSYAHVLATMKDGPLRARVLSARETKDLATREVSRDISRKVATLAQTMTPAVYTAEPDQLLQRLVRESLFHVSSNRRRLATYALGLSPYAPAVADCFISLAGSERELLGERAWESIWALGHGSRREDVVALVDADHTWTQRRALISLARSPQRLTTAEQARIKVAMRHESASVRRAALYATGLQAPHHLPNPLETKASPDASVVTWWRRVGPAIRDSDGLGRPAPRPREE